MSIYDSTQMDGMAPEHQAERAILHTLTRIRDHGIVGYYMGLGGQSFDLLTEAYAALTGEPVANIRRAFQCRSPRPADRENHG